MSARGRSDAKVLFLGKSNDAYVEDAIRYLLLNFADAHIHVGAWGDSLPPEVTSWSGDYLISYMSRWIVTSTMLDRASCEALNFHPGPPEYPGFGCNNQALYRGADTYGVTCHRMNARPDAGEILDVVRFPVFPEDDVASLLRRTCQHQILQFYRIVDRIACGTELRPSGDTWTRKAFTRKDLAELMTLKAEMSADEVLKRVRATRHGHSGPSLEFAGLTFKLASDHSMQ